MRCASPPKHLIAKGKNWLLHLIEKAQLHIGCLGMRLKKQWRILRLPSDIDRVGRYSFNNGQV